MDLDLRRLIPSFFRKQPASCHFKTTYRPVAENVSEIMAYLRPEGKRVLSVAAFGYPLVFLAEGAGTSGYQNFDSLVTVYEKQN